MFEAPRKIRPVAVGAGDVGVGFAPLAQIDFSEVLSTLWRGKWTIVADSARACARVRRGGAELTTLGPRHPAVLNIQAQADRLRHMIDSEIDRTAVAARTEYESAKASERTIADNVKALEGTTVNTNQAMVGLRALEREAQASRDLYQAFLVRARETGEQQQIDTKNIRSFPRLTCRCGAARRRRAF
ncbi:MAG: hypothetical protein WBE82_09485 [Xanthobacteraceae bacterium]